MVNNSVDLLKSGEKYQEVDINGVRYLAIRKLETFIQSALEQFWIPNLLLFS